eukprot:2554243-Amphidinium_carterae.1
MAGTFWNCGTCGFYKLRLQNRVFCLQERPRECQDPEDRWTCIKAWITGSKARTTGYTGRATAYKKRIQWSNHTGQPFDGANSAQADQSRQGRPGADGDLGECSFYTYHLQAASAS